MNARADASPKRGLVLEGGGAKGAYAFGCLKAFKEFGIHFDAVAGTSVGGINAVLWASNQMAMGEEYWTKLHPDRVFRYRALGILLFPIILFRWLIYSAMHYLAIAPYALSGVWATFAKQAAGWLFFIFAAWIVYQVFHWERAHQYSRDLWMAIWLTGAYAVLRSVPAALDRHGVSLLTPRPLREQVRRILAGWSRDIPVYVTVAEQVDLIDPDCPAFIQTSLDPEMNPQFQLVPAITRIPKYLLLNGLSQTDQVEAVIAGAALPESIFPEVTLEGINYRDGGVIDNLPVYPLISLEHCDEIVVVQLRPKEEAVAGDPEVGYDVGYLQHWQRMNRFLRLRELPPTQAYSLVSQAHEAGTLVSKTSDYAPRLFPFQESPREPRFVTIAPKESLGSFLTGTMRFEGRSTTQWMELGYGDACEAIERHSLGSARPVGEADIKVSWPEDVGRQAAPSVDEAEAAQRLKVSPEQIRFLVDSGAFRTVWRPEGRRIPLSELVRYRKTLFRMKLPGRVIGVGLLAWALFFNGSGLQKVLLAATGLLMVTTGATGSSVNVNMQGPVACGCLLVGIILAAAYIAWRLWGR